MPERPEQDEAPKVRRGRGRRPAAEVRADALDAAGALLLDRGMAQFTIEAVADTAGVSRTTIYKWWPSKGALALDGYFHAVESALTFPTAATSRRTCGHSSGRSSTSSPRPLPGG
ncbi:helix-turn-helix domain-containing protein [Kitasatospora sp. NBC_01539]|uniref:helix-turn-helix domain-containing protein n=1 Tax=Kitasatospora sp. NBC_01539 TaxID=2903577 RepID=UPI0038602680